MKKNKGNALIIIAIVVVVIIILGIIGYFVYEYLNSEKNNQNLYNNEFVEQNEYSNIDTSNIKVYDHVEKGKYLGETLNNKLYLVFKKEGNFVDYKEYI